MSEMHPSKAHHSMAPPSSGLRLGFTDIRPTTGPAHLPAIAQSTPSKIGHALPSSDFTFRFTREVASDLKLGPEAQRIMADLREETARIKADLKAKAEAEKQAEGEANGRRIAKPKGKAGRFSAAHMAEFKKMDSIENHPSAFRAQPGRFAPSTGLKRTQSKANLNDSETPRSKGSLKRTQSKANLNDSETPRSKGKMLAHPRPAAKASDEPESPVKRAKQRLEDDTSSSRPISRDGSFIPRPKSSGNDVSGISRSKSVASLMTPTKSSLARAAAAKTPMGSKIKSPSLLSGLKRSATTRAPGTGTGIARIVSPNITIRSPSGSRTFAKVRSMFRSDKTVSDKTKSSIPVMPGSTTSLALDKPLPSLPKATPAKAAKHVVFTPQTKRVLETTQASPSPIKSGIPKSKIRQPLGEVRYPTLDTVMTGDDDTTDDVSYPDLSSHKALPELPASAAKSTVAATAPGTFTFRSDKTISFGPTSPKGFGSSPGQSSVRRVRPSIALHTMPGSFPAAPGTNTTTSTSSGSPNKENEAPAPASAASASVFKALPHGMINKKRHRVSSDEEEAERAEAERAAKKRRAEAVPEGEALLAPRLMAGASGRKLKQPSTALGSSSPAKMMFGTPLGVSAAAASPSPRKKAGMSLSRLNMLARPKNRK